MIPDFRWPAQRLVLEADGATWHDTAVARAEDAERQALLEACGERVLRVTWNQAVQRQRETLARIRAAGAPLATERRLRARNSITQRNLGGHGVMFLRDRRACDRRALSGLGRGPRRAPASPLGGG
ncbi:MAG: endonuclease domain-containing protein [Solirubrobacterales bacterium]